MISHAPPPPPDDGNRPSAGPRPPYGGSGNGSRGAGNWLHSRSRGRLSWHVPLQLAEAFLVGRGSGGPAGGLVRFRISDGREAGRSRRPSWHRTDLGRQLAGSGGELRLVHPYDGTGTRRALIPMLTLNGITDVAALVRLSVVGPLPSVPGRGSGHAAILGVDVRFLAGLWSLAVPEHTRCHVHLEGRVRVMPDWPMPR